MTADANRISIVICTRNRSALLRGALESIASARPAKHHQVEIVVVLNACSDDSAAVVESFSDRLPVRSVVEPRPGHSRARNAGVAAARGGTIAWLDDDVRVAPAWLAALDEAFARWPDVDLFGGPIRPVFVDGPPPWLERTWRQHATAFAAREVPDGDGRIKARPCPYGANFAIRTEVQKRYPYDPALGRRPGYFLMGGEEVSVIRAILAGGGSGRWVPDAAVDHVIPPERQTVGYLRAYFGGQGYELASRPPRHGAPPKSFLQDAAEYLRAEARYRWMRIAAGPEAWVPALARAGEMQGRVARRASSLLRESGGRAKRS